MEPAKACWVLPAEPRAICDWQLVHASQHQRWCQQTNTTEPCPLLLLLHCSLTAELAVEKRRVAELEAALAEEKRRVAEEKRRVAELEAVLAEEKGKAAEKKALLLTTQQKLKEAAAAIAVAVAGQQPSLGALMSTSRSNVDLGGNME
jgi:septal ring factor EnvC (AmiA/AmiB activator)